MIDFRKSTSKRAVSPTPGESAYERFGPTLIASSVSAARRRLARADKARSDMEAFTVVSSMRQCVRALVAPTPALAVPSGGSAGTLRRTAGNGPSSAWRTPARMPRRCRHTGRIWRGFARCHGPLQPLPTDTAQRSRCPAQCIAPSSSRPALAVTLWRSRCMRLRIHCRLECRRCTVDAPFDSFLCCATRWQRSKANGGPVQGPPFLANPRQRTPCPRLLAYGRTLMQ